MITVDMIKEFCPNGKNLPAIVTALNVRMAEFGIVTKDQIAMFLAQTIHESGGYSRFDENLNYSAAGLMSTWPTRFKTLAEASKYARQPNKIANKVYANRLGNGDESSNEGWLFRGRGAIQVTGKTNYKLLDKAVPSLKVLTAPDVLTNPDGAIVSACWYWKSNDLNRFANKKDIVGCSKAVNGGSIGLTDRKRIYESMLKKLG